MTHRTRKISKPDVDSKLLSSSKKQVYTYVTHVHSSAAQKYCQVEYISLIRPQDLRPPGYMVNSVVVLTEAM